MKLTRVLVLAVAIVVTACGAPRPTHVPEHLDCGLDRFAVSDVFAGWHAFRRQAGTAGASAGHAAEGPHVLALSAGGELGVFGAGFLAGWREAGVSAQPISRDDVQVVTGVSAGALLATQAFIGDDAHLYHVLPEIGKDQLFSNRYLSLLRANALWNDSGKDAVQAEVVLANDVIEAVTRQPAGRFLYVGVVDIDSGRFLQIDMVRLAREIAPPSRRDACYRAVIGASTAIPVLMGPKFVDAMMLADGALRHHLFVPALPAQVASTGRGRIMVVINQDVRPMDSAQCDGSSGQTCNGLFPIAARSAAIAVDQALRDSLAAIETLAHAKVTPSGQSGFETSYVSASEAVQACAEIRRTRCGSSAAQGSADFCPRFMRCVADHGRLQGLRAASSNPPWSSFEGLHLDSAVPQRPK